VNIKVFGVHSDGGFAEYVAVPEGRLYRVPPQLSDDDAALIEPLTIGYQAVSRADVADGETVAIIGAGPIGVLCQLVAKERGARVLISDVLDEKLEFAREMGADAVVNSRRESLAERIRDFTAGEGANVVIEAVGLPQTVEAAIEVVSSAGRVVLLGLGPHDVRLRPADIIHKELDLRGSRMNSRRFGEAIELAATAGLPLQKLVTHHLPLDAVADAFRLFDESPAEVCKVVLQP
jgi:L-gulonate 5-dehydrogenase